MRTIVVGMRIGGVILFHGGRRWESVMPASPVQMVVFHLETHVSATLSGFRLVCRCLRCSMGHVWLTIISVVVWLAKFVRSAIFYAKMPVLY